MLDLAPEIENSVLDSAASEGISVNELLARHFPPKTKPQLETPEQTAQRMLGLLAKWQAKNPLPVPLSGFKSLAELRAEWASEDAQKTETELAAERELWEKHIQAIIDSPGVSI